MRLKGLGAEEMARRSRTLSAVPENPRFPAPLWWTYITAPPENPTFCSFWPPGLLEHQAQTYAAGTQRQNSHPHTWNIFKTKCYQLLRGSVLHRSFPTVTELKAPLYPSTALLILVLSGLTCRERPCMCVPATPQHLVPWTVPDGRNGRPCSPPHTP